MTSVQRGFLWLLTGSLLCAPVWLPRSNSPASTSKRNTRSRLLGPVAALVSNFQWLRVERARRRGRHDLVFALGANALAWDSRSTSGWELLAQHQALLLGSTLREDDPERRSGWLRAGLSTAQLGEAHVKHPERLALLAGMMLQVHAERDERTAWPGGSSGLWRDAHAQYLRAAKLGLADARGLADYAHDRWHDAAPPSSDAAKETEGF